VRVARRQFLPSRSELGAEDLEHGFPAFVSLIERIKEVGPLLFWYLSRFHFQCSFSAVCKGAGAARVRARS
jgi:hypothetical protein